jgi:hypothetical protein
VTPEGELRLFLGSWNMGNALPPADLSWIPLDRDL